MDNACDPVVVETLRAAGARGDALDALVAYTDNPFAAPAAAGLDLPLADEAHAEAWDDYLHESARDGVPAALARRLVQLRFPIEAGISQSDAYRAATRRGVWPPGDGPGIALEDPAGLSLEMKPSLAGRVPVVRCRNRRDFVTLVRALSCRNEPEPVPESQGAAIVTGLNNWDRVARARRRMEAERGAPFDDASWAEAFRSIVPQKGLYQDRVIVLSQEPYSAVPAADVGLPDGEWRERSVAIRAEHECTHYFTVRAFGVMRNNLLDEVIADCAGVLAAFGRYEAALALRFLGLEGWPRYRPGGRFENYLQAPPVPEDAVPPLQAIVVRAARCIEAVSGALDLSGAAARARFVVALARTSLVALASDEGRRRLETAWDALPPIRLGRSDPGPMPPGASSFSC